MVKLTASDLYVGAYIAKLYYSRTPPYIWKIVRMDSSAITGRDADGVEETYSKPEGEISLVDGLIAEIERSRVRLRPATAAEAAAYDAQARN